MPRSETGFCTLAGTERPKDECSPSACMFRMTLFGRLATFCRRLTALLQNLALCLGVARHPLRIGLRTQPLKHLLDGRRGARCQARVHPPHELDQFFQP